MVRAPRLANPLFGKENVLKIRMLVEQRHPWQAGHVPSGAIVDVDAQAAKELLNAGQAEAVRERVERAVTPASEDAADVVPRARRRRGA